MIAFIHESKHTGPDEEAVPSQPSTPVTYLDPPNIQLNVSSNTSESPFKKRFELFLAGLAAVILQCGLIVIAAVTMFYEGARNAIGGAEVYGFPCYTIGSVLLSIGMAICSLAIEQSTGEREWKRSKNVTKSNQGENEQRQGESNERPQLIFLQPGQRVQVSIMIIIKAFT